jgi:hypothetical protein
VKEIKSVFLKKKPNGEPLDNEKSPFLAAICDEELKEPPQLELVPHGLILVAVVDNVGLSGKFEAALVVDNKFDHGRVYRNFTSGEDPRPVRFFLVKREWVRQMTDKPLVSDQEGGE